jgi:molybdopterin synthase catalytic subunit
MIQIRTEKIDPWKEIQRYQNSLNIQGKFGATAVFVGSMRDMNEGEQVSAMTLEHYPGMTDKYLHKITQEAHQQWPLLDSLILHRVGDVYPDDTIVVVAVWSTHRADAFTACRSLMEQLKSEAPFWKKEQLSNGSRWVEKNTPG